MKRVRNELAAKAIFAAFVSLLIVGIYFLIREDQASPAQNDGNTPSRSTVLITSPKQETVIAQDGDWRKHPREEDGDGKSQVKPNRKMGEDPMLKSSDPSRLARYADEKRPNASSVSIPDDKEEEVFWALRVISMNAGSQHKKILYEVQPKLELLARNGSNGAMRELASEALRKCE